MKKTRGLRGFHWSNYREKYQRAGSKAHDLSAESSPATLGVTFSAFTDPEQKMVFTSVIPDLMLADVNSTCVTATFNRQSLFQTHI